MTNVHVRYEDKLSVPGHPFAVGFTLASFSAVSTDENWERTFIHNSAKGIHKLSNLDSMAIYFDTDATSLAGLDPDEAHAKFTELVATREHMPKHQFVLKPVNGLGRLIIRHAITKDVPKTDAELSFEELGFVVDEDQYRDALSMVDLFHFYTRQHQYRRFRPSDEVIAKDKSRALLIFAFQSIRNEVHERHRKWSWDYFKERRDDRTEYVSLFKLTGGQDMSPEVRAMITRA